MGFISRDSIRAISERCDIVDLVRTYVPNLKKAGTRWKALCPFHEDSAPSFFVNPERGTYKCFGCGEGGDAISFVMKIEKVDYPDALRFLANKLGIMVIEEENGDGKKKAEDRKRGYDVNTVGMQFFEEMLHHATIGAKAREYIAKRKLSPEMVAKFHLGFAPDQWDAVQKYGVEHGCRIEELANVGLIQPRERGGYYDFFRDRLMFPIFDTQDRVVGFGGRALGDNPAKYINSPETPLFAKSKLLYGLNFSREKARDSRHLIVVEGYTDVIMMFQHGICEAVAPLGTALTADHVRLMKRYADEVTTLFDGDEAGLKAAERSLDIFLEVDMPTRVVILPEEKDPCDILVEKGGDFFRAQLQAGEEVVEFKLRRALGKFDPRNIHERAQAVKLVAEVIGKITDPIKRGLWTHNIAERFSLSADVLTQEIRKGGRKTGSSAEKVEQEILRRDPGERLLLKLMIHCPANISEARRLVPESLFTTPDHARIFCELAKFEEESQFNFSVLLGALENPEDRQYAGTLMDEDPEWREAAPVFKDCVVRLLERQRREQARELLRKITAAETEGRGNDASQLLADYKQLIQRKE